MWRVVSTSTDAFGNVAEDGEADFGQCGGRIDEEKERHSLERRRRRRKCSFMWADNFWIMSHSKEHLFEEAGKSGLGAPNQRVCGGQARMLQKIRLT